MGMNPASKNSQLLRVLAEGPATTGEIVAETGWPPKNIVARLTVQMKAGRVQRTPYQAEGEQSRWLWALSAKVNQARECYLAPSAFPHS